MSFVLILLLWMPAGGAFSYPDHALALTSATFYTEQRCKDAGKRAAEQFGLLRDPAGGTRSEVATWICVPQ